MTRRFFAVLASVAILAGTSAPAQAPKAPSWGFQWMTGYELRDPSRPYFTNRDYPGAYNPQIATYIAYSNVKDMGPTDDTGSAASSANFCKGFLAIHGAVRAREMNLACQGVYWRSFPTKAQADAELAKSLSDFRKQPAEPKKEFLFDDFKAVGSTRSYLKLR